jgi:hypothetical protein
MGKKSSNPVNVLKSSINKASDVVSKTYDVVSKDVSKTVAQIIPENMIKDKKDEPKKESKPEIKIVEEAIKQELTPYESQIQSLYVGCFSDDPSNPSMEKDLGDISNSLECIELGKKNNYKYVGIQQGNKCFGSNKIPIAQEVDRTVYCNVGCDDINTGNCGGFFYNQVYRTDINDTALNKLGNKLKEEKDKDKKISNEMLEKFMNIDTDIEKINYGLAHGNYNCHTPIDSYIIFFWIVILVILLYLLFEYIYKKTEKKI